MERDELINEILKAEWQMFTNVNGGSGRASCQDDNKTFTVMRKAQADIWGKATLVSYLKDLKTAAEQGVNLMSVKYAYMMEVTHPEEYLKIKERLPVVSDAVSELVNKIAEYHLGWSLDASKKYPRLFSLGRPVDSGSGVSQQTISIQNYLRSELLTYSEKTLKLCLEDTLEAFDNKRNLSLEILKNTAKNYGYDSLDAIEERLSPK